MLTLDQTVINDGIQKLQSLGRDFHARGWSLATSSNYSIVISRQPLLLLMTASGKDKGCLCPSDFVIVDNSARIMRPAIESQDSTQLRPSAEADLHISIARLFGAYCVLHTHSIWSTVLSTKWPNKQCLSIAGLEMLKALNGIKTHEESISIPIFENTQDMKAMSALIEEKSNIISHAFLLKGHGLYTWGTSFEEAKRHLEALEFMLETCGRLGGLA